MKKLRVAAQAVAICAVIAFMSWTKSRGITVLIPHFSHRRQRHCGLLAPVTTAIAFCAARSGISKLGRASTAAGLRSGHLVTRPRTITGPIPAITYFQLPQSPKQKYGKSYTKRTQRIRHKLEAAARGVGVLAV
jgi:hypothetical protein